MKKSMLFAKVQKIFCLPVAGMNEVLALFIMVCSLPYKLVFKMKA